MKGGWQSATRPSESVTASVPWGWGTVVVVVGNGGVVPVVVMVDVGWVVGVVVGCGAVVVGVLAGVVTDGTAMLKNRQAEIEAPLKRYPVPVPPASTSGTPVRHNGYVDLCRSGQATCALTFCLRGVHVWP